MIVKMKLIVNISPVDHFSRKMQLLLSELQNLRPKIEHFACVGNFFAQRTFLKYFQCFIHDPPYT